MNKRKRFGGATRIQRRTFLKSVAAAAALFPFAYLPWPAITRAETRNPIKIGIIGSGRIGGTVGALWVKAGHKVLFSSRHPEELKDLTASLDPRASAGMPNAAAAWASLSRPDNQCASYAFITNNRRLNVVLRRIHFKSTLSFQKSEGFITMAANTFSIQCEYNRQM